MWQSISRPFQIPELRYKILFTLLMLVVCRLGGFIPVPGINGEVALGFFKQATGGSQNLFQLVDIFSGGAFSQMTIIALGVVPYISASIIMQLLMALVPTFQREMKENSVQARRKVGRYTRGLALALAFLQSFAYARYSVGMNAMSPGIISPLLLDIQLAGVPWLFYLVTVFSMTTGTLFLMWIGELISDKGIGNGMSMIITLGIVSQLPTALGMIFQQLNLTSQEPGQMNFAYLAILLTIFVLVTIGTILITQGHRRIPLQYARRMVGRKEMQGGGSSYIPLKINYAGVIPVIFASSLLMLPMTIASFLGSGNWLGNMAMWLSQEGNPYLVMMVLLIFFFTFFWTASQFHPDQIASDMKKNGAFIPGIKQGKPTHEYLETTMNRVTFLGALFLALIAILPTVIGRFMGVSPTIRYFFGGTALLILVGVILDTMKQIDSHLLMNRYEGFMKRGKVRDR